MDWLSYIWVNYILEFSKVVNADVNVASDLPAILLGIVVAYLTILISVAIVIFSEEKEFKVLDKNVILDHIIKAKNLLLYLGFTFIPLLFWNGSLPWTRLLELFSWIIGVIFMTNILIGSYHWMKGNKFQFRFEYLRKLKNIQDMEEAWRSVWQTENINPWNEKDFFTIFHSTVNRLLENDEKDNLIIASKLLGDFNNLIDKRSAFFLTRSDKALAGVLQWHFEAWKKEQEYFLQERKSDEWGMCRELSRTLDSIFKQIEICAFKEWTFSFFDKLKKHVEKYKGESASSRSYVEYLFNTFYQVFFQNIYDAPERFDIWNHYFPGEWKITKKNLENSEINTICKISLGHFFTWASDRIWRANQERDFVLNEVSTNLFPEVDPMLWAEILIFIFSRPSEELLRQVIEKPWNFGFMGRVKVYHGPQEDELIRMNIEEEKKTFDLSYLLFKEQFSKIKLESYIKSLEQLSYPEEPERERKRLKLYGLFTKMLDFGEKKMWKDDQPSKS